MTDDIIHVDNPLYWERYIDRCRLRIEQQARAAKQHESQGARGENRLRAIVYDMWRQLRACDHSRTRIERSIPVEHEGVTLDADTETKRCTDCRRVVQARPL